MCVDTDASRRASPQRRERERETAQAESLGSGAVVHQSLAFKGCTLSQYTSAYDSRGSEVSQTVTVSQSAS